MGVSEKATLSAESLEDYKDTSFDLPEAAATGPCLLLQDSSRDGLLSYI